LKRLGSAHRSTFLVEITAALAADLATLSETVDDPGADFPDSLRQFAADIRVAVGSYLGLSVTIVARGERISLIALEDFAQPGEIVSSLMFSLEPAASDRVGSGALAVPAVSFVLYAGKPGAFIDLAADLSWLTGRELTHFAVDQHLSFPDDPTAASALAAASLVNQAIGVLIARGRTPEQAHDEVIERATHAGIDRRVAAGAILASVHRAIPDVC